ncbi:MAG: T9SS type A sorting domain-containing protein [Microscillaceae bacterium]|nr:T9SS type A sorting domain-containing protein [Microscillaceae bacterium]
MAPNGTAEAVYNIHGNLNGRKNEMVAEGRYSVGHTIHTYKGNWFCYGRGFSGYGGHTQTNGTTWQAVYCATGGLGDESEACDIICYENVEGTCNSFSIGEFGQPTANFPAFVPTSAEANFFMVNGLFVEEAQQPAKVWCQTLQRSVPGSVGYYVFRGWFQNVKSGGQSGDVPQIRITVCDMEDPLTKIIPDATITPLTPDTPLPGTTRTPDPAGPTIHVPTPVQNPVNMDASTLGDMTLAAGGAAGTRYEYGAAMPCNAPSEASNARLKVLGSSFYLEQEPDQWQLMRCIYRAPAGISEFNLCVENESLTKNGNDFAMDDLELRECENADAAAFDRLLRGDPCELADDGEALGSSALNVSLLDFAGALLGDKVVLSWLVAQENDLSHYEIERSLNGQTFSFLGQKDPKASDGAEFKEYFYQDALLPEGTNFLYYRLKMVKTNGGASHSGIIRIDLRNLQVLPIRLAPNPVAAGETATLRFEASEGSAQMVISDMMGRILHQSTLITLEGNQEIALETEGLPAGLYIIRIQQGPRRNSIKLVVK